MLCVAARPPRLWPSASAEIHDRAQAVGRIRQDEETQPNTLQPTPSRKSPERQDFICYRCKAYTALDLTSAQPTGDLELNSKLAPRHPT